MRQKPEITNTRAAGLDHQVVTVTGGSGAYRRRPCSDCPWRCDAVGEFPAEAFLYSADTAYDMAENTFACHQSGTDTPSTCAGFLMRGADHNLAVRLRLAQRTLDLAQVSDGGIKLFDSYHDMAVANGVAADHPRLARCRP